MPTLKIAYVINSVEAGGAAMPVPAIARAISEIGAELHILALTGRDRRALPAMLAAGIDVHVRPDGESDHFSALRWLDCTVAFLKPDIIWTSLTRATLLGQLVGAHHRVPVVSWQHAAFLRPANRALLRFTKNRSALWIADSSTVNAFTQSQLGISADKVVTWPLFAADPGAPQAPTWRPGQKMRVGSLGRLHPVKGYDVLIRALAKLSVAAPDHSPEIEVVICGEGGDRSRLTELAREMGVSSLSLSGYCADPRQFLAGLHLYVQPSKSEGFCVAAHEAMQAGVPVIASTVGELARSVESGETGLLVPPGDPAALADAIQLCVSKPERLKTMGEAGRARLLSRFSEKEFLRGAGEIVGRLEKLSRER